MDPEKLKSKAEGKKVLVVGGTAGIGKALAIALIKLKADVTIVGRREPDAALAEARWIQKDLSLLKSANSLAAECNVKCLDVIVFTVGTMAGPEKRLTDEGIEVDLATSFLSRMAVCKQIIHDGKMGTKRPHPDNKPRVFIMGYPGKETKPDTDDFMAQKSYDPVQVHNNTIVGNEALINWMAEKDKLVHVYGLNPGMIQTDLRKNYLGKDTYLNWAVESAVGLVSQTAEQYAENVLVHLLFSSTLELQNTSIFNYDGSLLPANPLLTDRMRKRILNEAEEVIEAATKKSSKLGNAISKGFDKLGKLSSKIESEITDAFSESSMKQTGLKAALGGGIVP
ncbi:hypothetical protein HDV03_001033 [Kappamyces sp. JEL0829]|nr:hypothetical protein HDV03_001033 [Kappamyces sp. JEL0829]